MNVCLVFTKLFKHALVFRLTRLFRDGGQISRQLYSQMDPFRDKQQNEVELQPSTAHRVWMYART